MSRTKREVRATYARQSIEQFFDLHGSGESSQISGILQQLGFSAAVNEVVLDPQTYVYPQADTSYRADVTMSSEQDKIAVVAHTVGEKVTYRALQHRLQQPFPEDYQTKDCVFALGKTSGAMTAYEVAPAYEGEATTLCAGRPIVLLRHYPRRSHHVPSVVAHELVHVAQALMGTRMAHEHLMLDDELAAYAVEARIGRGYMHDLSDGNETLDTALQMDSWRRTHLGDDSYTSNHNLRTEIMRSATLGYLLPQSS